MKFYNIVKKIIIIVLFLLYIGYLFYKAPIFNHFKILNLIEYFIVLFGGGYLNFIFLKREIYPIFKKD
ncbi:hypothetical protein D3Z33_16005 [Senegalia massiliensis]|uniref:Uncharacterized protein n=1 Tax=Senegalia massiliensis TaxID=1720316 RepID=A0A845QZH4_9CLOT|nr:hypothetical protein [Senegalia massiliensis]